MADKDIAKMDTFDFSITIEKLRPIIDPLHINYNQNIPFPATILLEMSQFPEFAVFFFAGEKIWEEIYSYAFESSKKIQEKSKLPSLRINDSKLYEQFMSPNFPNRCMAIGRAASQKNLDDFFAVCVPERPIRMQEIYPLTQSETELSIDFVHRNPDYFMAMMGIKLCLISYFQGLSLSLLQAIKFDTNSQSSSEPQQHLKFKDAFIRLLGNARDFSLIQDFTPILANTLRQDEEPWSCRVLGEAIKDTFKRHAFKSINPSGVYKECPFSKSLINCLSIGFDTVTGQPIPHHGHGALILWAMDKVQKEYLSQKPADHITQHFNL